MVYIERKKIGNNYYLYEKRSYRDSTGKVKTKHVKYLGKELPSELPKRDTTD